MHAGSCRAYACSVAGCALTYRLRFALVRVCLPTLPPDDLVGQELRGAAAGVPQVLFSSGGVHTHPRARQPHMVPVRVWWVGMQGVVPRGNAQQGGQRHAMPLPARRGLLRAWPGVEQGARRTGRTGGGWRAGEGRQHALGARALAGWVPPGANAVRSCCRLWKLARACGLHAGFEGDACERKKQDSCLNSCSGHGTCEGGWCHCEEGRWVA